MAPLHIACAHSGSAKAERSFQELAHVYKFVPPEECDVILAPGGIGKDHLAKFVGDGVIVATPAGSTAYNFSAHRPIVPLGARILALTPVSPFRPRRWRGALLSHNAEVRIENLDPGKRPLSATADFQELFEVISVSVQENPSKSARILFDRDHSLQESVLREQFVG